MIEQVFQAIAAVVVSVAFCLLYFAGTNWVLDKFTQRPKGDPTAKRPRADAIEAGATPKSVAQKALKDSWKVRERERNREREGESSPHCLPACLPFYTISALTVILAPKVTNLHLD